MGDMRTWGTYTASMISGNTLTSICTLNKGVESYDNLTVYVPTMTSATDIYLQGSLDGTTFGRVYSDPVSGVAADKLIRIGSGISQAFVDIQGFKFPYLKIEHSTACTATSHVYKIIIS